MRRYNPKVIEPKWQKVWAETGLYKTDMKAAERKYYTIPMLPYTSGDIHIGHWYNFGPTDSVARFNRMQGKNVLTTIGFDAFGLPAENAAIKRGTQPAEWTKKNIASMTGQLKRIGASYDWDHSLATSDPEYYRWTQWLFLQLYKHKLAYRAKSLVNWCPKDQTVLANEQVVGENNVCERCGTPVEQKEMEQWFFKITDFADRLLDDLENMDWPPKIKLMQENWIGKSRGSLIKFKVAAQDTGHRKQDTDEIEVFTTRPDTIFGATYMVLAPEHPMVSKLTVESHKSKVTSYVRETSRKTELERKAAEKQKTGVFTGAYAVNPANKEKIPVWVAEYVLMGYGTGAIMAVPAHDERDGAFAEAHKLPIQQVIAPYEVFSGFQAPRDDVETIFRQSVDAIITDGSENYLLIYEDDQVHFVGGGVDEDDENEIDAVKREVIEESGYTDITSINQIAPYAAGIAYRHTKNINQGGWGAFYEVVLGDKTQIKSEVDEGKHKIEWVPKNKVAGRLTWSWHLDAWNFYLNEKAAEIHEGEGILVNSGKYNGQKSFKAREKMAADFGKEQTQFRLRDWLISRQRYWGPPIPMIYCEKCGIVPVPEKDLPVILPEDVTFELSGRSPLTDRPDFVNVKCPDCDGPAKRETDTMDTFVDSSWYFLRYLDNDNNQAVFNTEVINKWAPVDHYIGGIEHAILHLLYARFITKFLHDQHGLAFEEPFVKLTSQGIILGPDGLKMSKSRGNVVNPDEQVESYGADSLRLYLMFMGPYEQGGPYNLGGITGTRRFLERVWSLVGEYQKAGDGQLGSVPAAALTAATHRTVKAVTQDLEKLAFNTAIASLMSFINELYQLKADLPISKNGPWQEAIETLVLLLAPLAPHITEELWEELGYDTSVHRSAWPAWNEELIKDETMTIAIQVNGKVRGEIEIETDASEDQVINAAKAEPKIADLLAGKKLKKAIYVPGRLVSLVI